MTNNEKWTTFDDIPKIGQYIYIKDNIDNEILVEVIIPSPKEILILFIELNSKWKQNNETPETKDNMVINKDHWKDWNWRPHTCIINGEYSISEGIE